MIKDIIFAGRNVLRNTRRSLTTGLAIAVGTIAIVLSGGFVNTIQRGMETNIARTDGHLHIYAQDYLRYGASRSNDYFVEAPEALIARLQSDAQLSRQVRVATPVLRFSGIASHYEADANKTFIGLGMVPETHNRLLSFDPWSLGGTTEPWPLSSNRPREAVLGEGMARMLAFCTELKVADCKQPERIGQPLSEQQAADEDFRSLSQVIVSELSDGIGMTSALDILAATASGTPNLISLQPVAFRQQAVAAVDDALVAIPFATAQQLIYPDADRATAIILQLHHSHFLPSALARLQTLFADEPVEIRTLEEFNPLLTRVLAMFRVILLGLILVVGTVVMFTVANTMSMAVLERTGEIGTLRALGMRRNRIRRLFFLEGLWLGVTSVLVGLLSAALLAAVINRAGLEWIPPSSSSPAPLLLMIDQPAMLFMVFTLVPAAAAMAAWMSARHAARMPIVDALRRI